MKITRIKSKNTVSLQHNFKGEKSFFSDDTKTLLDFISIIFFPVFAQQPHYHKKYHLCCMQTIWVYLANSTPQGN